MAMRNYWLEASIDGRTTRLTGGPQAKEGGFVLCIYIRQHGNSTPALVVEGLSDGKELILQIDPCLPIADQRSGGVQIIRSVR